MRCLALLLLLACPVLAAEPTVTVMMPGVLVAGQTGEVTVGVSAPSVEVVIKASLTYDGGTVEAECPLTIRYPMSNPVSVQLPPELKYVEGSAKRDGVPVPVLATSAGKIVCPIAAGTIAAEVTLGVTVN